MHALPVDFPLTAYVGYAVVDVTEGAHFVELHLAREFRRAKISFEGPGQFLAPGHQAIAFSNADLTVGAERFAKLTGAAVQDVRRTQEPGVQFVFDSGQVLTLLDNPGSYESYHLNVEGASCDV